MTQTTTTKLDRLTTLRAALIDCMTDCTGDRDEWQTYSTMLARVGDMLTDERRRQGYMAVYPIKDGSAQGAIFEGTREQCKLYTDILLEAHPEMKGTIIVVQL